MRHLQLLLLFLVAAYSAAQETPQESHLTEPGSGVVFARSVFAHGYRHGYEQGYHLGNLDINMGRAARSKKAQFHGLTLGYSSSFGPRRSFEAGFQAGLRAGYGDGYDGRTFRAVESARSLAKALPAVSPPSDPTSFYFDQGIVAGYRDGVQKAPAAPAGLFTPSCARFRPQRREDVSAEASFCEGYRRGLLLGRGDAAALSANWPPLEASK